jgi:hypothetical protein
VKINWGHEYQTRQSGRHRPFVCPLVYDQNSLSANATNGTPSATQQAAAASQKREAVGRYPPREGGAKTADTQTRDAVGVRRERFECIALKGETSATPQPVCYNHGNAPKRNTAQERTGQNRVFPGLGSRNPSEVETGFTDRYNIKIHTDQQLTCGIHYQRRGGIRNPLQSEKRREYI